MSSPLTASPSGWKWPAAKARPNDQFKKNVYDRLMEMTKGRGPDRCIEAVGAESHGGLVTNAIDSAKAALHSAAISRTP